MGNSGLEYPSSSYQQSTSFITSPSGVNDISTPPRNHNCGLCSASFQRREHFERHSLSHSKIRDFRCDVCDKRFARRDTLQRHLAIHGQVSARVQKALPRASRACINCVKSKQRCSGAHPCERCSRKRVNCQFTSSSGQTSSLGREVTEGTGSHGTSNHGHNDSGTKAVSELSHISGRSAVNAISSPGTMPPNRSNSASEPCAPIDFLDQAGYFPQESEATSIFDSFLLWPLDDFTEHYNVASAVPSDNQTHTGLASALEPSICASRVETSGSLTPLLQGAPVQAALSQTSRSSSGAPPQAHASEYTVTEEDHDILASEDYGNIPKPSISTYNSICARHAELFQNPSEARIPTLEILHVCTELYFEHFHRRFPILHQGTFTARSESWLLYLAVAAVGSQYSRLSIRENVFFGLLKIIRESLMRKLGSAASLQNNLELTQATLLFNISLTFSGIHEQAMHVQYQRNVLVTMCRPLLIRGVLFEKRCILSNEVVSVGDWFRWIATESWKRVAYFTWFCECLQLIIFDLPSLVTPGDMNFTMPCNDELWQCPSFPDWERVKNSQCDKQQDPSVPALLKKEVLSQEYIRSFSESALWISIFAVYVAERQASEHQCLHLYRSNHGATDHRTCSTEYDRESIDSTLGCFQQIVSQHRQDSPALHIASKFSRLVRILRFLPYRLMYISTGWMAQHHEIEATTKKLAQLLQAEPRQALRNFLNAAQLFRIIRTQHQFDPYDPFVLLITILYIWCYDRFVISNQSQFDTSGAPQQILRVDQDLSEDVQEQWIEGNIQIGKQLHISGIGVLNGQDSVPRILRETIRILDHGKEWSHMANSIRYALKQVASGESPGFAT